MKRMLLIITAVMFLASLAFITGCKKEEPAKPEAAAAPVEEKIKAGFIYIGPAGDFGWTYAHDQGRLYAEKELPWLESVVVESVPEGDAVRFIDRLVQEQKVDAIQPASATWKKQLRQLKNIPM